MSLYEILGLDSSASSIDIKKAYRSFAKKHHPDVSDDNFCDDMHDIQEAYEILSDPGKRHEYDTGEEEKIISMPRTRLQEEFNKIITSNR